MNEFSLDIPVIEDSPIQWPSDKPIKKVCVIGHGALAERQKPTYEHWLSQDVEVHCADTNPSKLEDCLEGIYRYVLPQDEPSLLSAGKFDLLCINNIPPLHLATALSYGTYAERIIIQKPQDLNYPFIRTIAQAPGYEIFRSKTVIHDHYRNKSSVAALTQQLPSLLQDYGKLRRLMFFLTESKSVNDEPERADSLDCGMIQDLAVHQIDLMLECLLNANKWRGRQNDERLYCRVGGKIDFAKCVKLREQHSILGDDVETFAAIDLRITEQIAFPGTARPHQHSTECQPTLIIGLWAILFGS
jgi:hypothetical protein